MAKYKSAYGGIEQTPLAAYAINAFDGVPVSMSLARERRRIGLAECLRKRVRFRKRLRMNAPGYAVERAGLIDFLSKRARPPL